MSNIFNNRKTNSVVPQKAPKLNTLENWAGQNSGREGEVSPMIDNKIGVFYRTQDGFARPVDKDDSGAAALLWGNERSHSNVFEKKPVLTTAEA